jgi:hypothetical protein
MNEKDKKLFEMLGIKEKHMDIIGRVALSPDNSPV